MSSLTVVIPILNEINNTYFWQNVELLSKHHSIELVVVDGGSQDGTIQQFEKRYTKLLSAETTSRALRINMGLEAATGPHILILHPRSLLTREALEYLCEHIKDLRWGGFTHSFDLDHPLLKFTSWYSNHIRAKMSGIVYLDHCIFLHKHMYMKIGPIPSVDIFEDTILSQNLKRCFGKPQILPQTVKTSAVRFKKNGIWRQAFTNQVLKWQFYLGKNHRKMNELYEKDVALNADYKKIK